MKIRSKKILPVYAAIAGDVIGSWLEDKYEWLLTYTDYPLFCEKCFPTDDTVFTVAIAESLLGDKVTPEKVVSYLQKWGRKYPDAGYGRSTKQWIFSEQPQPYGSYGNGGAMRVSPCAVVADSLDEALKLAALTCNVSHNSAEGVAGAEAIAAAIYLALEGKSKEEIKAYIELKFGYDLNTSIDARKEFYAGFSCRASDTVPQAIRCFLESSDVESAIRLGISLGSDADTLASMAAAIAAAYYGEVPFLDELMPFIPDDMKEVLEKFDYKLALPELKIRAQRYSALLCTAIDVFGRRYDNKKFINARTLKKWILSALPDHFYTRREKFVLNHLLGQSLYTGDIYTFDSKELKARYSDMDYLCRVLPWSEDAADADLAKITDKKEEELLEEENRLRKDKPRERKVKVPHYRYAESSFCNGNCMSANYIHDYDENVEVLE